MAKKFKDGLLLLGVVMALLGGMALATAAGLFVDGTDEARAQTPPVSVNKSDTGQDQYSPGDTIEWWLAFSVSSQTSETWQFNDPFLDGLTWTGLATIPFDQGLFCAPNLDNVICQVLQGTMPGTYYARVTFTVDSDAACGPRINNVYTGLITGQGAIRATDTIGIVNCQDGGTFTLCKEWRSNGVLSGTRSFTMEVSDSAQVRFFEFSGVEEGGDPVCQQVSVPSGPVRVAEDAPPGFDAPEWDINGNPFPDGDAVEFYMDGPLCLLQVQVQVMADALIPVGCTVTLTNEDNDTPTVTTTPVTSTPTIVVCARCNTQTVPTSTPTPPPPTSTPTPVVTQAPPTSTPTAGTGSGTGGLTDAQRTQTAVAAARTAAAQQTPLPPRTGLGGGSSAGSFNIALFALGLLVLSSGLGLIAVRGRR